MIISAQESLCAACDIAEDRNNGKLSQSDVIRLALPIAARAGLCLTHDGETIRFETAGRFETATTRIARAFSGILLQDIGRNNLAIVNARNASERYAGACATHDFCDANMAMGDAFLIVTGHEIDVASESDAALCNAAWSMARAAGFWIAEDRANVSR